MTTGGSRRLSSLGEAARSYARRGWPAFPLTEMSKVPKIGKKHGGHGHKDATTDLEQIAAWWCRWPNANIGIATGPASATLVLDVDAGAGKVGPESLRALEATHGRLPPTLKAITPTNGEHLFFEWPTGETLITIGAGQLGQDVDHRGDGGYIVVEPSRRPEGRYRFVDRDRPLAPAPGWLVELLRKPEPVQASPVLLVPRRRGGSSTYAETALNRAAAEVAGAPPRTGNGVLNGCAYSLGRLVGAGLLERAHVESVLLDAALRRGGETEGRARTIIASGLDAGVANPREVAPFRAVQP